MRSLFSSGWARVSAAAVCLTLLCAAIIGHAAHAAQTLEERKLSMRFDWYAPKIGACGSDCGGWIGAVGVVTSDTPKLFEQFARNRDLTGATVVLDSSGGSVLDAISMGRRWREIGLTTTVGIVVQRPTAGGGSERYAAPEGYCESMCVFLLLSGKSRHVPDGAHVRVHQIWMGDRAEDARAARYNADDLTIIERDIGRLAKFTFEMGGTGDLLALALSVPPWEPLYELSRAELKSTNVVSTGAMAEIAESKRSSMVASGKPIQDRFASATSEGETTLTIMSPTQTADAEKSAAAGYQDRH